MWKVPLDGCRGGLVTRDLGQGWNRLKVLIAVDGRNLFRVLLKKTRTGCDEISGRNGRQSFATREGCSGARAPQPNRAEGVSLDHTGCKSLQICLSGSRRTSDGALRANRSSGSIGGKEAYENRGKLHRDCAEMRRKRHIRSGQTWLF